MPKKPGLARQVAMVGAGMSRFGAFPEKDSKDLFVEAFGSMLASVDKPFDPDAIQALYLGNFSNDFFVHQAHWGPIIADAVGLVPKPATRTEGACASSALAFREGVLAIAAGLYDLVLVGGVEVMSRRSTEEVAEGLALATMPCEGQVGFTFPGVFGVTASAYFHKFGATRSHLMDVTIKSHKNGKLNPKAQYRDTIADIMGKKREKAQATGVPQPEWADEKAFLGDPRANPMVAWPLHLFDCCPISDGASCVLLASADMAKKFSDHPLLVAGLGQGSGHGLNAKKDLASFEATRAAAAEAYAMSRLEPKDIQLCEVHDCFSIAELIHLEDLGFFPPGHGCRATAEGRTSLRGDMPINTSGGLKCKGHPVGATGVSQMVEIWQQLRGEAGPRQVPIPDLRVGATHNLGGTGGTCTFTIFERM
ncbi:MAG: propanoyl-CoA acyltransferase [Desulfarculaceae bacterium]|nr:propanoyl-CoA acyltransferase [Desulfarculaceae bacterium]